MLYLQPAVSDAIVQPSLYYVSWKYGDIKPKVDINIQTKDLNGHHSEKHENKGILQRS